MPKEVIDTAKSSPVVGPYSKGIGIRPGRLVLVSGQVGRHPDGRIAGPDVKSQTRQALENIRAVLEAAGGNLNDVVKTTTYLTRAEDYKDFNEVRSQFFRSGSYPASTAVVVKALVSEGLVVEIEALAVLP